MLQRIPLPTSLPTLGRRSIVSYVWESRFVLEKEPTILEKNSLPFRAKEALLPVTLLVFQRQGVFLVVLFPIVPFRSSLLSLVFRPLPNLILPV